MTPDEIKRLAFTGAQGADWGQQSENATSSVTYSDLLIQIRLGRARTGKLIATSTPVAGAMTIDLTGTDLDGDPKVIAWSCPASEGTHNVTPNMEYWIEYRATVDGTETPILTERWYVPAQVAIP